MFGTLKRYVIRKRFAAMVNVFDDKIEAARAAHQPVAHLIKAKSAYVHSKLEGASHATKAASGFARRLTTSEGH